MKSKYALFALMLPALTSCSDQGTTPDSELAGGVLATFQVEGEAFRFWTTNPQTIQDLLTLEAGQSLATIPNGPLRPGSGTGNHNLPWGWHLDPDGTHLAENTIEVCSGLPSFVDENLSDWLALGQYCPWSAQLVELEDFR